MAASNRGNAFVALVALLGLAAWGGWMIRDGSRERGLATARLVGVEAAGAAAADPTPVRLRGLLVGLPEAPVTAAGETYALQTVTMSHDEGTGDDRETITDYERRLPAQLFLSAGDSAIALEADAIDERYLPVVVRGETDGEGRLPDSVARHVATAFTEIPAEREASVQVLGIRAADSVTAYGTIELRDGLPVLVAPSNGDPLVVSTASFDEIRRQVTENDRGSRMVGWFVLALGLLGAAVVWWFGVRS